jgi:WD40 repeat protein
VDHVILPKVGWTKFLLLLYLPMLPAGCGWYDMFASPPIPDIPPMPSEADIERMQQRMMGRSPAKTVPVNTDGVEVVFQTGHAGGIHAVASSPNGRYVASSGSQDGTVKIWDIGSGQEIRNFTGFGGIGQSADLVAFSEDSVQLVTHEMSGAIKVFEVASGRELRAIGSLLDGGGAMSANGRFAAVNDRGETNPNDRRAFGATHPLSVIDLSTGRTLWTVPDSAMQRPLTLSRDGKILITVRTDVGISGSSGIIGTIGSAVGSMIGLDAFMRSEPDLPGFKQELLVWDVSAKKLRRSVPYAAMTDGVNATLSPDGRYLVTEQHLERTIRVLDLQSEKPAAIAIGGTGIKGSGMTHSLTFSPDGKLLAIAKGDGAAKLFEFPSGREVKEFEAASFNFSPDGRTWIIGPMSGGAPYLHEAASGKETRLAGGASEVSELALTADGRSVVAGMHGGSAKLWTLATGHLLRTFECPDGMAVSSVAVSNTGPLLATGCMNGSAWLWDLATGKQLKKLTPPLPPDRYTQVFVRITADGRTIVIGRGDQVIASDLSSGKELRRITLPKEALKGLASLEDPTAAYEGFDPTIRSMMKDRAPTQPSIDAETMERIKESSQWLRSLAVHPNGQLVAIGRSESTGLWNLQTGEQVLEFRDVSRLQARMQRQRHQDQQYQQMLDEANSWKSLLPSLPFGLGRSAPSGAGSPQIVMMDDPSELMEDLANQSHGARSLAFSPDGKFLVTDGVRGKALWNVATGEKVRASKRNAGRSLDPMSFLDTMEVNIDGMGAAFSPDGKLAARGHGQILTVWNVATGQDVLQLVGHTGGIRSLVFSPDGRFLVSAGGDGAIRLWNLQGGKELAALIALGREDFVAVTPDQYYRASKSRIKGVAFRVKGQLYPFEQFDLRFNRPDIVLARLGMASNELINSYRLAYEKRLKKMGLTEHMLGMDFHFPEIGLIGDVPVSVSQSSLTLRIKATDSKYPLDRLNVFVNDIPVHGTSGLPIRNRQLMTHEQEIHVPLIRGRNKIQVSVLNQQGTESLRETVYTSSTADFPPPDVYVVGIGVSEYQDKAYNLRYAAKDAADLMHTYKAVEQRPGVKGAVHLLDLTNQKATKTEIRKAKDWLKQSKINDLVIVFAAGHGMTDEQFDYYFGTHDIDPKHPATNGLPYEDFEHLLDGIPALQKVLLLDTCFSGEIEKDQAVVVAQADTGEVRAGTVKMRSFKAARGVSVVADEPQSTTNGGIPVLSTDLLKFQQDWFADLRRGTGAAVISSSSGNEYSLEGEQWKNGVFTYSLLNGLKNHEADANKDRMITVSELQAYVIEQVRKLTQGGQNPTVRRENLEHDFVVY